MSSFIQLMFNREFLGAIALLLAAVLSIVIHEISHGYMALWNGDSTAKNNGRLTLNPVKHFDLAGFLMFAIIGFGWAKPVPVNSRNYKNYKKGLFTVAIAGVLANFILAFFFYPLFYVANNFMKTGIFQNFLLWFSFGMFSINLMLIVFNLLPIYPLDGFRVIEALTPYGNKYVKFMYQYGSYCLIGFLVLIMLLSYFSIDLLGPVVNAVGWPIEKFWGLFF